MSVDCTMACSVSGNGWKQYDKRGEELAGVVTLEFVYDWVCRDVTKVGQKEPEKAPEKMTLADKRKLYTGNRKKVADFTEHVLTQVCAAY